MSVAITAEVPQAVKQRHPLHLRSTIGAKKRRGKGKKKAQERDEGSKGDVLGAHVSSYTQLSSPELAAKDTCTH